jgi:hypothetical protein
MERWKINFLQNDLPPLVTLTEDSSDEDGEQSSESDDGFSIEELESAVFSENEEDILTDMKVVEPEVEDADNREVKLIFKIRIFFSRYFCKDESQKKFDCKENGNVTERVIQIQLEDGTILDKRRLERDEGQR